MDALQRWHVLRLYVEDHVPLATLARDHGTGVRWHARYRASGYTGAWARCRARTRAATACPPSSSP